MPTNLPPDYFEVEKRYRAAHDPAEKIALLEELISTVPRHKGTEKLLGDLRRRLSRLKDASQTRKKAARHESVYHIDREGAGQVVVTGPTNVGKSSLVAALTNAEPQVAASPYTTWTPTPGMMDVENVQIQLIDTPPLDREYVEPQLLDLMRRADLLLLMVDIQASTIQQLEDALVLLAEHRIAPPEMQDQHRQRRRMSFVPTLVVVNKCDDTRCREDYEVLRELLSWDVPMLPLSIQNERNLERLKRRVFEALQIIRVYAKPPGKEPDLSAPFVLQAGSTVEDLAGMIHQDFLANLKAARVWGTGVHDGQLVGRDHVLHDGDVVELRM